MNTEKPTMHYAWKIVIACIMMKIGLGGACSVAMSNFVTPIVNDLGCSVSSLTTYTSCNAIAMALLYTTAAKYLSTRRPELVIGIASIVEAIALALMATYTRVEMFYFSGALMGIAQAFTGFVALPILLNMWFKKSNGTVLGLVVAVGTVAGMIYTVLSAQLIIHLGWRTAYLVLAAIGSIITIPSVFFLIRSPKQIGCEPYCAEEASSSDTRVKKQLITAPRDLTKKEAFRMPLLYIAWIACIMYSYSCGVAGYVTPFATMELGQTIAFGSAVGVCSNVGGTFSSLIVGKINDRYGVKAGLLWGTVTTALGYCAMFLSYRNPIFVLPAIFIVGLGNSMYMVQCPLLAQSIVGSRHYSEIWSRMMLVNSLIGGGLYASIGLFYDKLGSYRGAFLLAVIFYAVASILGMISIDKGRKIRPEAAKE